MFGKLFGGNAAPAPEVAVPLPTNSSISGPNLGDEAALVQQLTSGDVAAQTDALRRLLALTKWTARRDSEDAQDENWRIFYIEHGNRDKVFSANNVIPSVVRLLDNTAPTAIPTTTTLLASTTMITTTIQFLALQICSNLAREATEQRASKLLDTNIIHAIAENNLISGSNANKEAHFHAGVVLCGLVSAPNLPGREACRAVVDAGFLPVLLSALVDKDTNVDAQVQFVRTMGVIAAAKPSTPLFTQEWCISVAKVCVSLCQGTAPALQSACLHTLHTLAKDSIIAKMCIENSYHKVLGVLLHPNNPAIFKGKHASKQMNNGMLVVKIVCAMCLDDWCYTQMATGSTILSDMLGFLCSGLEPAKLTDSRDIWWDIETTDITDIHRTRRHDTAITVACAAWILALILLRTSTQKSVNLPPLSDPVMTRLRGQTVVAILRECSNSGDAFAYQYAARALAEMEMFEEIPLFRVRQSPLVLQLDTPHSSQPVGDIRKWGEEDVLNWVVSQRFGVYESCFRASWVDGELLIALSDADLAQIGVGNPVHRKFILRAIKRLQNIHGSSATMSPPQDSPRDLPVVPADLTFNVFISYRRSTGSELAQLLKMHLENLGFKVFLDIDCLGKGDFISHILRSLEMSQHFLPILTSGEANKTVGYFDRCKGDVNVEDNVHKEIVHAVKLRKTIVPVFVSGYQWPIMEELPPVCKNITAHNAVEWIPQYHQAALDKLRRFLQ